MGKLIRTKKGGLTLATAGHDASEQRLGLGAAVPQDSSLSRTCILKGCTCMGCAMVMCLQMG